MTTYWTYEFTVWTEDAREPAGHTVRSTRLWPNTPDPAFAAMAEEFADAAMAQGEPVEYGCGERPGEWWLKCCGVSGTGRLVQMRVVGA